MSEGDWSNLQAAEQADIDESHSIYRAKQLATLAVEHNIDQAAASGLKQNIKALKWPDTGNIEKKISAADFQEVLAGVKSLNKKLPFLDYSKWSVRQYLLLSRPYSQLS